MPYFKASQFDDDLDVPREFMTPEQQRIHDEMLAQRDAERAERAERIKFNQMQEAAAAEQKKWQIKAQLEFDRLRAEAFRLGRLYFQSGEGVAAPINWDQPISEMVWSTEPALNKRIINSLASERWGYKTVGDVYEMSKSEARRLPGVGNRIATAIEDCFLSLGWRWDGPIGPKLTLPDDPAAAKRWVEAFDAVNVISYRRRYDPVLVFDVIGEGPFPLECLGYDGSWPDSIDDCKTMTALDHRSVRLRSRHEPNFYEWHKTGWRIVPIDAQTRS